MSTTSPLCHGCRKPTDAPERWYIGDWKKPSPDRTGTAKFRLCGSCEFDLIYSGHPRVPRGQLRKIRSTYAALARSAVALKAIKRNLGVR